MNYFNKMDPNESAVVLKGIPKELREQITVSPDTGNLFYGHNNNLCTTYTLVQKSLFRSYRELCESLECLEKGREEHKPTAKELAKKSKTLLTAKLEELVQGIEQGKIKLADLSEEDHRFWVLKLMKYFNVLIKSDPYYKVLNEHAVIFTEYYKRFRSFHPEENQEHTKKLIDLLQK